MNNSTLVSHHALPPDACLHNEYVIQEILGEGGFGITYGGYRIGDGVHVAIKEYYPRQIALRTEQNGVFLIQPFPEKQRETYQRELQRFLNEANVLYQLQHLENIVSIYDFFEENGTAYLVMEYIEGPTLKQFVLENGPFSFPELLHLIGPVIHALSEVHKQGLIHRDISPDNLILGIDNKLHLIDFGAAAHDKRNNTQNTIILKAGYAPPEQYISGGNIGVWVDVYALCATMCFALTGEAPCEAMRRLHAETTDALPSLAGLLPKQQEALKKGLELRPANRFHDMEKLYDALTAAEDSETAKTQLGSGLSKEQMRKFNRICHPLHMHRGIALVCLFLLLGITGVFAMPRLIDHKNNVADQPSAPNAITGAMASASAAPTQTAATSAPTSAALLKMADVSNMTLKKGKNAIKKLDREIRIETKSKYHQTVPDGHIITQSVAPNTLFSKGGISSILLTISKGKKSAKSAKSTASNQPPATQTPYPHQTKDKKQEDYDVKGKDDYITIPME